MDVLLLILQVIGVLIWVSIMLPVLILVSKFLFFFQYFSNGKQWRPV